MLVCEYGLNGQSLLDITPLEGEISVTE